MCIYFITSLQWTMCNLFHVHNLTSIIHHVYYFITSQSWTICIYFITSLSTLKAKLHFLHPQKPQCELEIQSGHPIIFICEHVKLSRPTEDYHVTSERCHFHSV